MSILILTIALFFLRLPVYQTSIEQWLSTTLSQPVTIGRIATYWTGLKPTIALHQLRIFNRTHQSTIIEIGYAEVQVNLIESLQQMQLLTSHIILSQTQLALAQASSGQISVVGLPSQTQGNNNHLRQWLLLQPRFSLNAYRLTWWTPQQRAFVFMNPHLTLQRQSHHYQITAQVNLPQPAWSPLLRGTVSFTGTGQWKNNRWILLTGQMIAQQFQLVVEQKILDLPYLRGQITVQQMRQHSWQVMLKELLLKTPQQQWANNELTLKLIFQRYGTEITAQLKFLPAELLFAGLTAVNPQSSLKKFEGNLYDIQWNSYLTIKNWQLKTKFTKLALELEHSSSPQSTTQQTLQGQNLSGQLALDPKNGRIHLTTGSVQWHDTHLYSHPINLQQLKGEISGQYLTSPLSTQRQHRGLKKHEWQLNTKGLQAVDRGWSWSFVGGVTLPMTQGVPKMDLTLTGQGGQVTQISDYIPDKLLSHLANWSKTAFVSGQLQTAKITFQGALNELFTGKKKGFGLQATFKNLKFNYAPEWPVLDHLNADIVINQQLLTIVTDTGHLLQSRLKKFKGRVENLYTAPLLHLEGQLQTTMSDSLQFIRSSPLHKTIHLDHLSLAGEINLQLKLAIALPSAHLNAINGQILLKNTTLTEKSSGITVDNMKGFIQFDQQKISSNKISGELFDQPILFSFVKKFDDPLKPLSIQMSGHANSEFIHRQLAHFNLKFSAFPLAKILSGETTWSGTLDISEQTGGQNLHLYVATDLVGMALDLPDPVGKTAASVWPAHLDLNFSTSGKDTLQIQYGTIVQGMFLIENKSLERGTLWLGDVEPLQISHAHGISIIGHLPDFSVTTWRDELSTITTTTEPSEQPKQYDLTGLGEIMFSFDRLEIFGQHFTKISLRSPQPTTQWKITLKGNEVEGDLILNRDPKKPALNLVFSRLNLALAQIETSTITSEEEVADSTDLRQLPALAFHCDSLQIGESHLGNVNFYTQPTEKGLQIDLFEAKAAHFSLQAKGQWLYQQQRTSMELNLHSDNVGQLLARFGYRHLPLVGQNTQINLTAQWPGLPYTFKLAKMEASLDFVVVKGQILTVEPGAAGRLFGLFDLQALPRRLILDFNDVFNTGFGFESLSGNFVIAQGRAYTENLVLQSSVAHILIQGHTDLINKNFDQTATIIPHVSNALPVAGALAGGLSIGAVVLVVQKLLQAEIEKAVNYQYSIKGLWAKPEVSLVSKRGSPQI